MAEQKIIRLIKSHHHRRNRVPELYEVGSLSRERSLSREPTLCQERSLSRWPLSQDSTNQEPTSNTVNSSNPVQTVSLIHDVAHLKQDLAMLQQSLGEILELHHKQLANLQGRVEKQEQVSGRKNDADDNVQDEALLAAVQAEGSRRLPADDGLVSAPQLQAVVRRLENLEQTQERLVQERAGEVERLAQARVVSSGPQDDEGNIFEKSASGNEDVASTTYSSDVLCYEFQESVWDAALFIFTKPVGVLGSCTMLLLLCLNIGMQALYTAIVMLEFTKPTFGTEDIEGFIEFRNRVAHDIKYIDPLTQASLASKVCQLNPGLEVAGQQVDALSQIRDYLPEDSFFGKYTGRMMCWLACITWTFCVMKEVKNCLSLSCAVLEHGVKNLPAARTGTRMMRGTGTWTIAQISGARLVFIFFVMILRLIASALLLWSGLKFLVNTIALTDLVLNAIALECVLSLDELIFEPFAPSRVRSLLAELEGLPIPSWCHKGGVDLHAFLGLLGSAIVLIVFVTPWLSDFVGDLTIVSTELCGGTKDFVMGSQSFAPFYVWASSKDPASGAINQYAQDLTNAIIKGSESELWNLALALKQKNTGGSYWSASTINSWSVKEASARWNNQCNDLWDKFSGLLDYTKAMIFKDVQGATGCHDLEPFCDDDSPRGSATRGICPVTCGCDTPAKKLILRSFEAGCPEGCELKTKYQAVLAAAECADKSLGTLQTDPDWIYMANMLPVIAERAQWPSFLMPDLLADKENMLEHGCDAIRKARDEYFVFSLDLCDEGYERGFPWKSLRLFCPVTCNCTSSARNCPRTCPPYLTL